MHAIPTRPAGWALLGVAAAAVTLVLLQVPRQRPGALRVPMIVPDEPPPPEPPAEAPALAPEPERPRRAVRVRTRDRLPAEVIEAIREGRGSLRACYERSLKRPSASVAEPLRLTLGFTVDTEAGRFRDVAIAPVRDPQLAACMRQAVARWKIPALSGEPFSVQTPITLIPTQE